MGILSFLDAHFVMRNTFPPRFEPKSARELRVFNEVVIAFGGPSGAFASMLRKQYASTRSGQLDAGPVTWSLLEHAILQHGTPGARVAWARANPR